MKAKAFLFAIFLLAATTNTFASSDDKGSKSSGKSQQKAVELKESSKELQKKTSCTVSVSYPNDNGKPTQITVTITCDCTQRAACDAAYQIATLPLL